VGRVVDFNCDLGESFGAYTIGADAEMMPVITSANVACGLHGGDPVVMERTVRLAREHGSESAPIRGSPTSRGSAAARCACRWTNCGRR